MPKDKTENHEKIVAAALQEFLDHGFADASMRRIAAACDLSASGLYKHFPSKEEMFAALVDPAIEGLMELFREVETEYAKGLPLPDESNSVAGRWETKSETVRAIEYIYDHADAFKLIIGKSQGTRYENFTHEMAKLEEEVTERYMQTLARTGVKIRQIRKEEFHLLVTSQVEAIFQVVIHDFSREEALHYAKTLEQFFLPGWKALFGL